MTLLLILISIEFLLFQQTIGIVNLDQQTANPIFRTRTDNDRSASAWRSGIDCLNEISKIFFIKRETITRSPNVLFIRAKNMQEPVGQILNGFLKLLNEDFTTDITADYQLRILTDNSTNYNRTKNHKNSNLDGYRYSTDYYVITIDSFQRLVELLKLSANNTASWNPGARFLVLYNNVEERECQMKRRRNLFKIEDPDELQNDSDNQCEEDSCTNQTDSENEILEKIYEHMNQKHYIHRIVVLYATDALNYSISSMDYFSEKACRTKSMIKFGFCSMGIIVPDLATVKYRINEVLNHKKSTKCIFHVCAAITAPFVEADCTNGLELYMLDFMKKHLKLQFNTTCFRENRGISIGSKNWTGLLGKLMFGECDFLLGGFYPDNDVAGAFGTTTCYLDDSYTWYIKLADERPAWMALYVIFDGPTFGCLFLMIPITWIFWYLLAKILPEPKGHKEFSLIGINNIGISISVAVNERPTCHATRVFWLLLAFYGLNIASLYTSRLISVFANPGYLHQIDNLDEVIEEGIPFGGPEENVDWFENDNDMWIYNRYSSSKLFIPNSKNLEAVMKGERVILSSRMYITQHVSSDKVFGFPESVFRSSVQMIMKPGFPFMYELNRLITEMNDAGIFSRLLESFYFNNTYLKRIAKNRPHFTETVIVLTLEHVEGPFTLLAYGTILSILILLIELCVHKFSSKKTKEKDKTENTKTILKKDKQKQISVKKQITKSKDQTTNRIRRKTNIRIRNIYNEKKTNENIIRLTPILNRDIANYNDNKIAKNHWFFESNFSKAIRNEN